MADFQAIVLKNGVVSRLGADTLTADTIDCSTPAGSLVFGSANANSIEIGADVSTTIITIGGNTGLTSLNIGTGLAETGTIDIGGGVDTQINLAAERVFASGNVEFTGNNIKFSENNIEFTEYTLIVSDILFDGVGVNRIIGIAGNEGTDLILQGSGTGGSVRLRPQGGNTYFGNYQGVAEDSYQLIIDGNDTQEGAGIRYNPVEERWEARADTQPWEPIAIGEPIPAGTVRQILQNNGTDWVATDTSALDASANYVFAPADGDNARSMTLRGQNAANGPGGAVYLLGGNTTGDGGSPLGGNAVIRGGNSENAVNGQVLIGDSNTSEIILGPAPITARSDISFTIGVGARSISVREETGAGGGGLSVSAGQAGGAALPGGNLSLAAGGGGTSGSGGLLEINGGNGGIDGGAVVIAAGTTLGSGTGGNVEILGGSGDVAGTGGAIEIHGGAGGTESGGGPGGNVEIRGGAGEYSTGGNVYIRSGYGSSENGSIVLGDVTTAEIAIGETNVSFHANARITSHLNFLYEDEGTRVIRVAARAGLPGGALAVTAGDGSLGGTLELTGGHSEGTGDGGDVLIYGGSSASSGVGGTVRVTGGAHGGTGTAGDVVLGDGTTNTANVYVGNATNGIRYGMTTQRLEAIGTGSINIDTTNSRLEINGTAVSGTGVTASNFNALFDGSTVTSHVHASSETSSNTKVSLTTTGLSAKDVAYISGTGAVGLANSQTSLTTAQVCGVVTAVGVVQVAGITTVTSVTAVTAGSHVYLAGTDGRVTATPPTTGYFVFLGYCTVGNASPGDIQILLQPARPIAM